MDRPKRTTQTLRLFRSRHVALASPLSGAFQHLPVLAGSVSSPWRSLSAPAARELRPGKPHNEINRLSVSLSPCGAAQLSEAVLLTALMWPGTQPETQDVMGEMTKGLLVPGRKLGKRSAQKGRIWRLQPTAKIKYMGGVACQTQWSQHLLWKRRAAGRRNSSTSWWW